MRVHLVGLVACLAALGAAGCGGSQTPAADLPPTIAPRAARDLLITAEDISRAGADSPSGAVLRWWQALQRQDLAAVRTAYAPSARTGDLREQLAALGTELTASRPVIDEEQLSGSVAEVSTILVGAEFPADGSPPGISEAPLTFRLVRSGSGWKLADNDLLRQKLSSQRARERSG